MVSELSLNVHVDRDPCIHFPVAGGSLAMLIPFNPQTLTTATPTRSGAIEVQAIYNERVSRNFINTKSPILCTVSHAEMVIVVEKTDG